jgi:hypothetical protein
VSKVKGKTREEIINNLAERIDKFEQYSTPHSQAMAEMALHLANRLGLSQADAKAIAEAARLHDIGLYALSPAYHATPAALRFEQRLDLWRHSIIGEQEMAKREASRYAQLLVRWHHEWWNGSGYPDMLAFEDIPIGARILRAVELYNALVAARPYRAALSKKEALEALKSSAGIECDPYIVHAMLALLEEMNVNTEVEPTVFADDAITTEKLEEIQAQDSIDTVPINQQRTDGESVSIASTDQQAADITQQDSYTTQEKAPEVQINQTISLQKTVPSAETDSSSGIWSNSLDGGATPSSNVWSLSPESTTIQNDSQITAPVANQSSAAAETASQNIVNETFFQSTNPLDAVDTLFAETPSTGTPVNTPTVETPVAKVASFPYQTTDLATGESTQPDTVSSETPATAITDVSQPQTFFSDTQQPEISFTKTPQVETVPVSASWSEPSISPIEAPQVQSSSNSVTDTPQTDLPAVAQVSIKQASLPQMLFRSEPKTVALDDSPNWLGWKASAYNKKSLLAFEASVLKQVSFATVAIPFSAEAKLDWYLKAWNKRILSNDSRAWAAVTSRAMIESTQTLSEENIVQLLTDIYVPGTRLGNPHLRRWFSETDAWWLDNLRRNIETLEDEKLRAQACLLGMQIGDYALSFTQETYELRRPLATVFWRLAGRFTIGAQPHPQNHSYNYQPLDFIRNARADLLYLNLPASHDENEGAQGRFQWRECWVKGLAADAEDFVQTLPAPQSKQAYLLRVDKMLRAGAHIKKWAIGCQESGLVSAREINDLVKEHRNVQATYSKDVTEVAGGARSYIIVAEKA